MATRVQDLPAVSPFLGTETVVVLKADNNLATMNSGQLRGPGWFWGNAAGVPSTNFTVSATDWDSAFGPYRSGDMYRRTIAGITTTYYWQQSDLSWQVMNDTQIQKFWDVNTSTTDYDTNTTGLVIDPTFTVDDFYRNLNDNKVYGPYVEGQGINFDPDAKLFYYDRGPQEHFSVELTAWNPWDTTTKTDAWYMPRHGDTYHQRLADPVHGGWTWTFNEVAYIADGGNVLAKRTAGWGTRVDRREPEYTSLASKPTGNPAFDDTRYRAGDTVLALDTLIVWGPYVTGQANIENSFGTGTSLAPDELNHVSVTSGIYTPQVTNSDYQVGDHIILFLTRGTVSTPILYHYDALNTWTFHGYLRSGTLFTQTQPDGGTFPDIANGVTDGFWIAAGTPVIGDQVVKVHTYPAGHAYGTQGQATGRETIQTVTAIDRVTGIVTYSAAVTHKPSRIHAGVIVGVRLRNDNDACAGDYLLDTRGALFGPYVEGQGTDALAWPVHSAASPDTFTITETADNYIPTPNNNLYVTGDVMNHVMSRGTGPSLFISFIYDSVTSGGVWVEQAVHRGSHVFTALQTDGAWPIFTDAGDALFVTQGNPIEGDIIRQVFTQQTGNQYGATVGVPTGKQVDSIVLTVDRTTGAITIGPDPSPISGRLHDKINAGRWLLDDNTFSEGDYLHDGDGVVYGPYSEGETVDATAWPVKVSAVTANTNIARDGGGATFTPKVDANNLFYVEDQSDGQDYYITAPFFQVTANLAVINGDHLVDTSGGVITLTLGAVTRFKVEDVRNNFSTNNCIVDFGGGTVATLSTDGDHFEFYLDGATWRFIDKNSIFGGAV